MATTETNGNGSGEFEVSDDLSALDVLLDGDIDKVMANLDRIVEAAPSYKKLISRWENQGWNSESFDFTRDAEEWNDGTTWSEEERRFMMFGLSQFFIGEERVTTELLPFAIAAPTDDQRIFLASQIADEARHCVFFDRFFREVLGSDAQTIAANLAAQRANTNDEFRQLFDGILHDCAETLRKDPSDMEALVRGITVYMVVIEGTLALTGARFIIRSLKEREWFPGFTAGFTAVNRDESRHVGFGVKFLADAIKDDPANATIIEDTLKETLPVASLVFVPPWVDDPYNFETPFYHSSEIFAYSLKALSKKLAAMGLDPAMLGAAA